MTTRFKLYYWPLPFRGCFVSYLFAYAGVPLEEETGYEAIQAMRTAPLAEQAIPFIGPPVLEDRETGVVLSQMPAILVYAADALGLEGGKDRDGAMRLKIIMDCNDVLMEICRYNGSMMWDRDSWIEFRSERLPRWLQLFEESLRRDHIKRDSLNVAEIAVYALFGNMMRCLPELEPDIREHAPGIHALCGQVASRSSLASYVADQAKAYGSLYCGGQIEESIRNMIAMDQSAGQ